MESSSQVVMSRMEAHVPLEGATNDTNVYDGLTYRQQRRAQQALRNGILLFLFLCDSNAFLISEIAQM